MALILAHVGIAGASTAKAGWVIDNSPTLASVLDKANAGIRRRVFMPTWAMSLVTSPSTLVGMVATSAVRSCGNWFNVAMANARRVTAKVVRHKPLWDRAIGLLVSKAMGMGVVPCAILTASEEELTIPILVKCAQPQPAWAKCWSALRKRAILIDLAPKALTWVLDWIGHIRMLPLSRVEVK